MKIVRVVDENIIFLKEFIENGDDAFITFRYFKSRDVSVIKNHLVTLLLFDNQSEKGLAYAHLDQFEEKIWLGLCVKSDYQKRGYGSRILKDLIKIATEINIKVISLTVDKENLHAIKLYERHNFKKNLFENEKYFLYELKIDE